jgi:hypothetical protein
MSSHNPEILEDDFPLLRNNVYITYGVSPKTGFNKELEV